jgi:hypothetical protein
LTVLIFFAGCSTIKPQFVSSATILIKTPKMKFYDKGFITKYRDYTNVQILQAGTSVLTLKMCLTTSNCKFTIASAANIPPRSGRRHLRYGKV